MIILERAEMRKTPGIGIVNKEIEESIEEISARTMPTTKTTINTISKQPLEDILNRIIKITRLTRKPFAVYTANKTKSNVYIDLRRVSNHYSVINNTASSLIDDPTLKVFTIKLI